MNCFRVWSKFCIVLPFTLASSVVSADIATAPLYLQAQVKPNIFFLADDSGSMDWEVLKSTGANQIPRYSGLRNSGDLNHSPNPTIVYATMEACAGYNVLYYDPAVTYSPWVGKDKDGVAYADQSITAARVNPYDSSKGTVNLTASSGGYYPGYYVWTDSDSDGVFDLGECPDPGLSGFNYSSQFVSTNASAGAGTMTAAQKTNFANWYSYYRKREYVAKSALLDIVNASTARMGIATIKRNGSVGYPAADMTVAANKEGLLTEIEKISSVGGTPLRSKLTQVGEYFKGTTDTGLFGSVQSSPILSQANGGSCQQNFTVVVSDGYWNGSAPSVGNADSGGTGDSNNTAFDGGVYADTYSNTLADVAMHYYENDLNTSLPNSVPTSDLDQNDKQHLVTYTVAFGVNGTLSAGPIEGATSFAWPEPTSSASTTIDDMRHAALNGRGEFLSASSPSALSEALNQAISSIAGATASSSSIATNSTRLDADAKIYQARFSSSTWEGSLLAYNLDPITGEVITPAAWDAADLIPSEDSRNIYTSTGAVASGVKFEYANLNATQKTQITSAQVDFIRGNTDNDGLLFRDRTKVLGDIVNSDPIYTSSDNFDYYKLETDSGADTYGAYLAGTTQNWQKGKRPDVIYYGANDGMLHAALGKDVSLITCTKICDEGKEIFSYIPKGLYQKAYDGNKGLADLTSKTYTHQYFVDGSPRHGDANIDFDGTGQTRWGTALVGTLGAGGRGIFALDISIPTSFTAADVLWDLDDTDTGMTDLGYTFSQPSIVKLAGDNGTNNNDWGVVVGNGFGSANGKAVLYIIGLKTGTVIWKKEVETASGTNGLATPVAVDTDNDKIADTVYAGDLLGNMWKFDISDSQVSKWDVAYSHKSGPTTINDPLFTACTDDPCTSRQPITSKPQVIRNDNGKLVVLFGTGKYFEDGDNTDFSQVQTFYGIEDAGAVVSGRSSLVAQDILYEKTAAQANLDFDVRVTSDTGVDFTVKDGWYLDFDNAFGNYPGERIVANPIVRNGRVIFPTLVPESDPCGYGGTSWLMELDAKTGSRLTVTPFDLNGDGVFDKNDWVDTDGDGIRDTPASGKKSTVGIVKKPGIISKGNSEKKYTSGSSGNIEVTTESSGDKLGRQSWQQIK